MALEGDNQKQADFLSRTLAECDRNGVPRVKPAPVDGSPLDVTITSHCPLQKPTAERMAAYLARVPRRAQRVAYLTNTGAAVSVLTLPRSSMIWPRRSPGRCGGMTRCDSCPS